MNRVMKMIPSRTLIMNQRNSSVTTQTFLHKPLFKSILRSKSISKQRSSLFTHPRSISSGLYYHEMNVSYDVTNPTTPPFRSLDFYPDSDGIRIVQSCNGLLLCRCDIRNEYDYEGNGNYYVFNPTTKKLALIPPVIGSPSAKSLIRFMGLAYHPIECVHYKLVCILRAGHNFDGYNEDGDRMYDIQIYYSHTRKWKKLKDQTFTPFDYTEFRYGVYWNGAFHWAPSCPNPMYLSLNSEQLQDLPLPLLPVRYGYGLRMPLYFGESRGHLHLVDISDENNPSSLTVYEMLSDHSGWFIKYQLDFRELFATYPNMTHTRSMFIDKYEFRVLDVVRGEEEEEDTFMVVKVIDNIMRYNILDKSFQQLSKIPNNIEEVEGVFRHAFSKTFHPFVGHRYIEKIGSV